MAYRNGIYVAFNGCGTAVPTESDIRYYNILKAWHNNKDIDFEFINSHEKTSPVKDSSSKETLIKRLSERLKDSKLLFLIVTDSTKNSSEILDYEITSAIDTREIPVVIAYTGMEIVKQFTSVLKSKLPAVLQKRIEEKKAKVLAVPFNLNAIKKAFSEFGVNDTTDKSNAIYCFDKVDSWD